MEIVVHEHRVTPAQERQHPPTSLLFPMAYLRSTTYTIQMPTMTREVIHEHHLRLSARRLCIHMPFCFLSAFNVTGPSDDDDAHEWYGGCQAPSAATYGGWASISVDLPRHTSLNSSFSHVSFVFYHCEHIVGRTSVLVMVEDNL